MTTNLLFSQSFTNGELNGSVGASSIPTNWSGVPNTDPNCQATSSNNATADVCNATGPFVGAGIAGNPYSGATFVSGLIGQVSASSVYHEGIQQTVSGFTPGDTYTIYFYQAVVKQTNALDQSGSWEIFIDNASAGVSTPSTSALAYHNVNLIWDLRTISFTATAASHVIKFLPADDDANSLLSSSDSNGALRMGLDLVSFSTSLPVEFLSFHAIYNSQNSNVDLDWETLSETNNDFFTIERSIDGKDWENIGTLQGNGTTNDMSNYQFSDHYPFKNISYYRLKQTDFDGKSSYSTVQSVMIEDENELLIYPNPAKNFLNISATNLKIEKVQIMDIKGKVCLSSSDSFGKINIEKLKNGIYILEIKTIQGKVLHKKFIKR